MDLPDKTQGKSWEGAEVVDRDGERLGTCVGVFADIDTDLTEWLQVDVAGHRPTFVPALDATEIGERVQVRFAKAQVLSAPQIGEDVELSQREEEQLYSHYGVAATTSESDSVLPVDVDASVPASSGAGTGALPAMDPDAATAPAAPRLRRVPRPDAAAPAPVPVHAASGGAPAQSSASSAGAPLAGIAGLVLGVWFVLRALERRAARRRSPAVRAERLRRQVGSGSAQAAKQASKQWAATADTRKRVAGAASSASDAAARQARVASGSLAAASAAAAQAASKAGSDVNSSAEDVSKKARKARKARERKRLRRSTAGRLAAVSGAATKAASDVGSSTSGVSKKARKARKRRSSGPLTGVTRSARRTSGQAAGSVSAAPKKAKQGSRSASKRVRKTGRSFVRSFWRLVTLGAAGGGYVLGAKAGRERYDELAVVAGNVAEHPQVRSVTESVTDPEKRSQALAAAQERLPGLGGSSQHS